MSPSGMVMKSMLFWSSRFATQARAKVPLYSALLFGSLLFARSTTLAWQMKYAPIMTDWAQLVDTNGPLPEYPRPQMVRSDWLNLNGIWQFQAGATNDPVP